ncbi:hypothetical protein GCM10017602_18040 [Herbiconiux flava]|nr:hypothetical protein GCM10017602_18040 [Herbiconiux flava]
MGGIGRRPVDESERYAELSSEQLNARISEREPPALQFRDDALSDPSGISKLSLRQPSGHSRCLQ